VTDLISILVIVYLLLLYAVDEANCICNEILGLWNFVKVKELNFVIL